MPNTASAMTTHNGGRSYEVTGARAGSATVRPVARPMATRDTGAGSRIRVSAAPSQARYASGPIVRNIPRNAGAASGPAPIGSTRHQAKAEMPAARVSAIGAAGREPGLETGYRPGAEPDPQAGRDDVGGVGQTRQALPRLGRVQQGGQDLLAPLDPVRPWVGEQQGPAPTRVSGARLTEPWASLRRRLAWRWRRQPWARRIWLERRRSRSTAASALLVRRCASASSVPAPSSVSR